ncbi:MAG: hypothetical protein PHN54_02495, partial [Bacilli bacterium]|nr:hypothetical protein [Bacilli bacterium]
MEEIMEFLSANWIYVGAASLVIIIIIIGIVAGTNKKNKKKANPDMISVSDNQNSDVQMGVAANAAASLEPVNSMEQKPLEVAEESSMPVSNEDFNPYAVNQPTDNQSMEPSTMSMPVEEPMMNTPVE